jgi:acyl-coenzyme A synthetase/AMP-(fatty) acid ligase
VVRFTSRFRGGGPGDHPFISLLQRGRASERHLIGYARFVEEFPTTVTGKIQKFVTRQRMVDESGLKVPKR